MHNIPSVELSSMGDINDLSNIKKAQLVSIFSGELSSREGLLNLRSVYSTQLIFYYLFIYFSKKKKKKKRKKKGGFKSAWG